MNIKKASLAIFLLLINFIASGQDSEKEINEQVWKPFVQALMARDAAAFMAVHSKDVMRVDRDGKSVINYEQYKDGTEKNWPKRKEDNIKNNIRHTFELRFLERASNGTQAFEVGYFKNESVNPNGEKRVGYGQFHVALHKENGVWKILVDSDSNNNGTITEEMFQAAKPLQ